MVELKPKSSSFNSLWCIVYCFIAIGTQCYISYQYFSDYQSSLRGKWKEHHPPELGLKLAFTIISFIILPLFIITSVFRFGNYANDGFKLGRDHALCPKGGFFEKRINSDIAKRLWKNFCPFSPTLHLLIAFCLLLPDILLSAVDVKYGFTSSDALWSSDVDFLFSKLRRFESDLLARNKNTSSLHNYTLLMQFHESENTISIAFLNFVFALICFSTRYASVFWYTNKTLSFLFVVQLLFMTFDSAIAYCGISVLYKVSTNMIEYGEYFSLALTSDVILALYIIGGFVIFLSSMIVFEYGAHHFMEKFRIVDRKHNPDAYNKETAIVRGSCNGYVTHTCAVIALILIALLRGPIYYDIVTLYRLTEDTLLLTTLIVCVSYLVFWIILWTLLTIKQEWMFRILDYANVGQPIFVIKSENLSKTNSISIGSIELKDLSLNKRKRPSSLPSVDLTPSESGFDEAELPPSCDDERYEISLPPVSENPGDNIDEFLSTNDMVIRRSRNRRSGNQRVTFHDPIRHSMGSLCEREGSRSRSPFGMDNKVNVTADVHNMGRLGPRSQFLRRSSDPDMKQAAIRRRQNNVALAAMRNNTLQDQKINNEYLTNVNDLSVSSDDIKSNASEPLINPQSSRRHERSKSQSYAENRASVNEMAFYKPSNIETAEQLDSSITTNSLQSEDTETKNETDASSNPENDQLNSTLTTDLTQKLSEHEYESFKGNKQPDIVPNEIFPRPLRFIPKKSDVIGRDSANCSMTSSQDTSSNESDQAPKQPSKRIR